MAYRVNGRFTVTNPGAGTQSGGTVTGVVGTYLDLTGLTTGLDIAVGQYFTNTSLDGRSWRWRITNITAQNAAGATFDVVFDDDPTNFDAALDATPISAGDSVITGPKTTEDCSFVPSHEQLQINEPLVQSINTTNCFEEKTDEVIENAGPLAGAAPAGAQWGVDTTTGQAYYVVAGNWTAVPVAAVDLNSTYGATQGIAYAGGAPVGAPAAPDNGDLFIQAYTTSIEVWVAAGGAFAGASNTSIPIGTTSTAADAISPAADDATGAIGVLTTEFALEDHKHPAQGVSADALNSITIGTDGLHYFAEGDEVIENAGALAGAAPAGAQWGVDTTTGQAYYIVAGNWAAAPGGADYATANLTADANRTHTWTTFNQVENFTTGTVQKNWDDTTGNTALVDFQTIRANLEYYNNTVGTSQEGLFEIDDSGFDVEITNYNADEGTVLLQRQDRLYLQAEERASGDQLQAGVYNDGNELYFNFHDNNGGSINNWDLRINDSAGVAGQVLTSQGVGNAPIWAAGGGPTAANAISPAADDATGAIGVNTTEFALEDHKHPAQGVSADANNDITVGADGLHYVSVAAEETTTSLAQAVATGIITFTDEDAGTQTANVVSTDALNDISAGSDGGAFVDVTAEETTTSLAQAVATGIITYTDEDAGTQTANIISTDALNDIAAGSDGGAFVDVTAEETTTSISQALATGIITHTDEDGGTQTANVVSTDALNDISVGTDGGAYLATSFEQAFVVGDWAGAGPFTYTVLAATHGLGAGKHHVSVFDAAGDLVGIQTNVNAAGDVVITTAGAVFAGSIYVS